MQFLAAEHPPCLAPSLRTPVEAPPARPIALTLLSKLCPGRREAEAFVEAAYAQAFASRLSAHYPILACLASADAQILGVAGLRYAEDERLFLECYLDQPVEAALSSAFGETPDRSAVAEIGALACSPQLSPQLFLALAAHLDSQGRRFAVATATRRLRRQFGRIGLQTRHLGEADPLRLSGQADAWGCYYARDPMVIAGRITPALPRLTESVQ